MMLIKNELWSLELKSIFLNWRVQAGSVGNIVFYAVSNRDENFIRSWGV